MVQVLKYVSEACDSCLEREPQCREPGELLLLWKVVQLLCQHKGDLHSALTPGVNDKRPGDICLSSSLLSPITSPQCRNAFLLSPDVSLFRFPV